MNHRRRLLLIFLIVLIYIFVDAKAKSQTMELTQLTATTSGHYQPDAVEVIVANPDSQQAKLTFTYHLFPTISSISPPSGKLAGGTNITLLSVAQDLSIRFQG